MAWVCDYCYGVMEESRAGKNRKRFLAPHVVLTGMWTTTTSISTMALRGAPMMKKTMKNK